MTPEELEKDNRRLDAMCPKGETPRKYSFLQKYYHKVLSYIENTCICLN